MIKATVNRGRASSADSLGGFAFSCCFFNAFSKDSSLNTYGRLLPIAMRVNSQQTLARPAAIFRYVFLC
jgi:hypothetical protein